MSNIGISSLPGAGIDQVLHPHFVAELPDFQKFRSVFEGGRQFIEKYLQKFSIRETTTDFNNRKKVTYAPTHAKSALVDIRNAIFQRMADITRRGGSDSYQNAVKGLGRGVDLRGSSMDAFMGRKIIDELLTMSRVGIYVDRPPVPQFSTLQQTNATQPYLYWYPAEDIRSWHFNEVNELDALLLEDHFFQKDEETGLISNEDTRFRLLRINEDGLVEVRFFVWEEKPRVAKQRQTVELLEERTVLALTRIPFVFLQLSHSLLQDVADIQIALLNMASSDINYSLKSNFPFYTEQYSPTSRLPHTRSPETEGTSSEANTSNNQQIEVGATQGRGYPKGLERPAFIHPSSEPLKASMEKQQKMVEEIRQLVNLALSNVRPVRASAESKQIDNQGLEAGLSYIGLELEHAEREVAKIWAEYENSDPAHIKYPDNYQLRTDKDRRQEAKELDDLKPATPSITYKKELCKQIARVTMGPKLDPDTLEKIEKEIDAATVVETDSETVRNDAEAGFVGTKLASQIRGYPEGEAEQAAKDHAERARRIALAQSSATNDSTPNPTARGLPDLGDPNGGKEEKEQSRNTDLDNSTADKTRGVGRSRERE